MRGVQRDRIEEAPVAVLSRSAVAGGAGRTLGQFVGVPHKPAQERNHVRVQVRPDLGNGALGTLPQFVGRTRRDGAVPVLARHVRNLPTVACHSSSIPAKLVASHLDQERR